MTCSNEGHGLGIKQMVQILTSAYYWLCGLGHVSKHSFLIFIFKTEILIE